MIARVLALFSSAVLMAAIAWLPVFAAGPTHSYLSTNVQPRVGSEVEVTLYVQSEVSPMNAVEASIAYNSQFFDLVEVNKSGSVISLWVLDPAATASPGQVRLAGTALNPGYLGPGAKIVSLRLRAKQTGQTSLALSGVSILANDGLGTDITGTAAGLDVNVLPAITPRPAPEPTAELTPAPDIQAPVSPESSLRIEKIINLIDEGGDLTEEEALAVLDHVSGEEILKTTPAAAAIAAKEKQVRRYQMITQVAAATNAVTIIAALVSWTRVAQLRSIIRGLSRGARVVVRK